MISVDIEDEDLISVLENVFKDSSIGYKVVGKDVILSLKILVKDKMERS